LQWFSGHLPKGFQDKFPKVEVSKGDVTLLCTPQINQKPNVDQQNLKLEGANQNNQIMNNKI
jgi:hypothetical protein